VDAEQSPNSTIFFATPYKGKAIRIRIAFFKLGLGILKGNIAFLLGLIARGDLPFPVRAERNKLPPSYSRCSRSR